MPNTRHIARHRQIAGVLLDEGFDRAIDQLGLRRFVPARSRFHREMLDSTPIEVRIRRTLERLGPTFVKIGQALATRPDLVSAPVARELRNLQDNVAPFPFEQAREVVEHELGAPLAELFGSFDATPLAAASIGQVHAATLLDGTPVVVKVQRPGVAKQVDIDLEIMLTQARWVRDHMELHVNYDLLAIADEFARAVHGELDYVAEAQNAERIGEVFADDETVAFPKVFWDRTTLRVLTLERFEGVAFNRPEALDEAGFDRAELARRGIFCYLEQIFSDGVYHADPHPGNLFALPDGRVAFTDFGRVGVLSERTRSQLADLFIGIIDRDERLAVDVLLEASGAPSDLDVPALRIEVSRLISKYYNVSLKRVRVRELFEDIMGLVHGYGCGLPSDLALLLSTLAVLEGVGHELDPDFDFVAVTAPFARRIVAERFAPAALSRSLTRSARHAFRLFADMPEQLARLMVRASDGELRLTIKPAGFEGPLLRFEEAVNRLSFAIVVAAFVLGLSLILSRIDLPNWFVVTAQLVMLGALGVGTWFFVSAVQAHYRKR